MQIRLDQKQKLEEGINKRGGCRNWVQVASNGLGGAVLCTLHQLWAGGRTTDFCLLQPGPEFGTPRYWNTVCLLAFLG